MWDISLLCNAELLQLISQSVKTELLIWHLLLKIIKEF